MADHTPPGTDEADLIRRMKAGEESAYSDLLEAYGGRLAGYLYKTFGRSLDQEDRARVVHYAMLGAWRNANTYDTSKASFRGWLIAITYHEAVNYLRGEKKHCHSEFQFADGYEPTVECNVEVEPKEACDSWEVTQLLDIIKNELSPNERFVIEADMAAGGEADNDFLAEKLQCSKSSVYSTRSKARRKIKESIERRKSERGRT